MEDSKAIALFPLIHLHPLPQTQEQQYHEKESNAGKDSAQDRIRT